MYFEKIMWHIQEIRISVAHLHREIHWNIIIILTAGEKKVTRNAESDNEP